MFTFNSSATRKYLSLFLTIILLTALIPTFPLSAAPSIKILNMYVVQDTALLDANGYPKDPSMIPNSTSKYFTIQGEFTDLSDTQINNLFYTVKNMDTGAEVTVTANKAVKTGTYSFQFTNVELTEGLNRVIIKLDDGGLISSAPGFIYYHAIPTISNVKLNELDFVDNLIAPADPALTGTNISITGKALNATEVKLYLEGNEVGINGYYNPGTGDFQFIGDKEGTLSRADFYLKAGDNFLTIEAANAEKKYNIKRHFIYNPGNSFSYNAMISYDHDNNNSTANLSEYLVKSPTVTANQSTTVNLTGNFKIDVDQDGNIIHNTVEVYLKNLNDTATAPVTTITINPDNSSTFTNGVSGSVTYNNTASAGKSYKIYNFSLNNLSLGTAKEQVVEYIFKNPNNSNYSPVTQTFTFKYLNPNLPYVDYVELGSTGVRLFDGNSFDGLPIELRVYTNSLADSIKLFLDGITTQVDAVIGTKVTTSDGKYYFPVTINNLPEGVHTLYIVPYDNSGNSNSDGQLLRTIEYINIPYVTFDNFYSGIVYNTNTGVPVGKDLAGNTYAPALNGRLKNIPFNERTKIQIAINGVTDYLTNDDFFNNTTTPTGDVVKDYSFLFKFAQIGSNTTRQAMKLNNGQNKIQVFIYDANNVKIAESSWDIFVFPKDVPEITKLEIHPDYIAQFTNTSTTGLLQYATTAKTVVIQGEFAYGDKVKINVRRTSDTSSNYETWTRTIYNTFAQTELVGSAIINTVTDIVTGETTQFLSRTITLSTTGKTTIEVEVTNASGITSQKILEIERTPVPYDIIYPNLKRTNVINSNFVNIQMVAEGADKVTFKGGDATKTKIYDRDGNLVDGFTYEVRGLKAGTNKITFTVVRGTTSITDTINIYYANTNTFGAQYKMPLNSTMKVFNGLATLKFPKGTVLRRNDENAVNQFLSAERQILFGIADPVDGRVDKYLHPTAQDREVGNPYPVISSSAPYYLTETTGRFRKASPMVWIDAGTLTAYETDLNKTVYGSGRDPYDPLEFYRRVESDLIVPSQRGTITLKYDPSIRYDSWRYITVFQYDYYEDYLGNKQWRWRNIGGVVDPKKNEITVPIDRFGYFVVMEMDQSFNDVIAHPWARNDLDTLYTRGIMLNKESNMFIPNEPISRGEFATMLVKIFALPLNYKGTPTFSDVRLINPFSYGLYEYKYLETAARAGIIRGTTGGRFLPDESISRQDAAVMIARAANYSLSVNSAKTLASLQKLFTDANTIDYYAQPAVFAVVKAKLMEGKPNVLLPGQKQTYYYDPLANMTRAEAARIAMNVLKQQKKIP